MTIGRQPLLYTYLQSQQLYPSVPSRLNPAFKIETICHRSVLRWARWERCAIVRRLSLVQLYNLYDSDRKIELLTWSSPELARESSVHRISSLRLKVTYLVLQESRSRSSTVQLEGKNPKFQPDPSYIGLTGRNTAQRKWQRISSSKVFRVVGWKSDLARSFGKSRSVRGVSRYRQPDTEQPIWVLFSKI